ncbi:MAG: hypothetical protein K2O45_12780 [Oscillospiraceae bacterium]|nr:hypothetical protein [Oscillospiraceae bacterium]
METRIRNGDYVPDGLGGVVRCQGADALLARVLFRLTARRGGLPFLPGLGSRLYLLSREPAAQRLSAARQYVAEALAEEAVHIMDVTLVPEGQGRVQVKVLLEYQGTELSVIVTA